MRGLPPQVVEVRCCYEPNYVSKQI
ncbi:protein of unknown function [Rhodovastum atsumiense]|nr:protein of unknown function [Rhodovastum atsumiense]